MSSSQLMRAGLIAGSLLLTGCMGAGDLSFGALGGSGSEDAAPQGAAFSYAKEQVLLLPFSVRLSKVASVLGVTTDDAALSELRARRLELGDYNFAQGVKPDRMWNAARISLWVRAMRSACGSEAIKKRFPSLPESLPALITAAYGRRATPEDGAAIDEALAGLSLDAEARYQSVCLAVLSSTEFVSR